MYVVAIIKEQAAAGKAVVAFSLPETPVHDALTAAGIPVQDAARESHLHLPDILRLRKLIQSSNAKIVHSHTHVDVWPASLAAMGTTVSHVHSSYMPPGQKRDFIHAIIYRRVDALVSSSLAANEKIKRQFPIAPEKVRLVRYGRHLEKFRNNEDVRADMRQKLGINEGELAVGMIGRVEEGKGVREFAESLSHLSEDVRSRVKFFIVGARKEDEGKEYSTCLQAFSEREGIRGRLTILPWTTETTPYLNALDVVVLASYNEMYSLSVIEAMAMHRPVIGTNTEGTPEQIGDNERGLLVEPRNPTSIAAAVTRYVTDRSLLEKQGALAAVWAHREHAMHRSLQALEQVYQSVCPRTPTPMVVSSLAKT